MKLSDLLFKPFLSVLEKAIDIEIDKGALAEFVLYLLGPEDKDPETVKRGDKVITGGKIVEAVDGSVIAAYIKKLRTWANGVVNYKP